jgi:hypothetical protein
LYKKFLNARSPLRLLEKGLHGGLGPGNLGVVIAGPGVGKTPFLVCVALDELLRSGNVLHVALDQTVGHVRAHYDTVFEDLASSTRLEDEAMVHSDIARRRSIRVYPPAAFNAAKLREAVKVETETGLKPGLVIVEGLDLETAPRQDVAELKDLARELGAEIWLSVATSEEEIDGIPPAVERIDDLVGVVLALEPAGDGVALRALKDHDNPDLTELHVSLDPRTLLLTRS